MLLGTTGLAIILRKCAPKLQEPATFLLTQGTERASLTPAKTTGNLADGVPGQVI